MELTQMIGAHLSRWPGMEPGDLIKLVYQSAMGPGHMIDDAEAFSARLARELSEIGPPTGQPYEPEHIGPRFSRVYLPALDPALRVETLARICVLTAEALPPDGHALAAGLDTLVALAPRLPYPPGVIEEAVKIFRAAGCPAVSHSERYRGLYAPHYRVVSRAAAFYLPVFSAIDRALAAKPHVLVGIDGMSGAGKSWLAAALQQVYGCGIVHADDFFLRPQQRTQERLEQAGGNIDYERFAPVAAKARDDRAFAYERFDCGAGALCGSRRVESSPLTVIEGVYSLHPEVGAECDVRVFLTLDAEVQAGRIQARSGPALARRFQREWIPMEHAYFNKFLIRESCDVVVDTTEL